MQINLTYAFAIKRIADVLDQIAMSDEWRFYSPTLPTSDWVEGRKPFARFFDPYEGREGEEWLGILEWAVLEQLRIKDRVLIINPETIDEVVARMTGHPDINIIY